MDKNLFNIEVPTEKLNSTLNNSINRGERYVKHNKFKKIATVCLLVGGLSIINVTKPALAEGIPVIGTVIQQLNNSLGINKDYKDYDKYAQSVDKIAKYNGVAVKVNDAILDDHNNLILSYEIKSEKGFTAEEKEYFESSDVAIQLEGIKRVDFQPNYNIAPEKAIKILPSLSKDGEMLDLEEVGGAIHGKFLNDSTFIAIAQYNMSSFEKVPNNFKMKIDINKIDFFVAMEEKTGKRYNSPQDLEGNWNLEFEVKKSKIKEVKTVKPNIQSEHVTINDITITPFTTDISVRIDFSKISKLKIVDENNNEYTNYSTINKKETEPKFSEITFRFMNIKKDVKNLKLIFLNNNNEVVFSSTVSIK